VSFPKGFVPSHENIKNYLYPDNDHGIYQYDYFAPIDQVIQTIMSDMIGQKPNDIPKLLDELEDDRDGNPPDLDDYRTGEPYPNNSYDWERYEADLKTYALSAIKKYDFEKEDLYVFSYSDNDGAYFTVLEHGDIFSNVKSQRFSHH
jgi:hypothetical protein